MNKTLKATAKVKEKEKAKILAKISKKGIPITKTRLQPLEMLTQQMITTLRILNPKETEKAKVGNGGTQTMQTDKKYQGVVWRQTARLQLIDSTLKKLC